jgi:hypothetical protein
MAGRRRDLHVPHVIAVTASAAHAAGQLGAGAELRVDGGACGFNGRCGISAGGGGRVVAGGVDVGSNGEIGCMVRAWLCAAFRCPSHLIARHPQASPWAATARSGAWWVRAWGHDACIYGGTRMERAQPPR